MSAELWFAIASLGFGVLSSFFAAMASIIAYFVKRQEGQRDKHIEQLQGDMEMVKAELAEYKGHVGIGDQRLAEIQTDLRDHVTREENIFWKKVDAISDAQRIFAEAVLQRLSGMEARMPNGELKDMGNAIARIEAALTSVARDATEARQHVIDHNREAEDWKRRIIALEAHHKGGRR